jgi:hypothetical protein
MFFVLIFAKEKSGPEFLLNFPKSKISKGFPSESLKSILKIFYISIDIGVDFRS